jgi:hypothetical protein
VCGPPVVGDPSAIDLFPVGVIDFAKGPNKGRVYYPAEGDGTGVAFNKRLAALGRVPLVVMAHGRSPNWMTFRQAQELGGHVRKGERSMPSVYWSFVERTDKETGEVKSVPFLKYFSVFNAE